MTTELNRDLKDFLEKRVGPFTFAMFMRSVRGLHDMTQSEAAKLLGISKGTLCDIEKGRQLVSATLAKKISKKFKPMYLQGYFYLSESDIKEISQQKKLDSMILLL